MANSYVLPPIYQAFVSTGSGTFPARKKARLGAGALISNPGELKPAQGIVNKAENGEVWPVAEPPTAL